MTETHAESASAAAAQARHILRLADRGALATMLRQAPGDPPGQPYASLVLVATDLDGSPVLLLSDLADHSKNIAAEPRVSLLLAPLWGSPEPLAEGRISVIGRAEPTGEPRLRERFLQRHPGAALYAGFADFRIYRVAVERALLVGGFGRIHWIGAEELLLPGNPAALWPALGNLVEQMNVGEGELVERLGTAASGMAAAWRLTGIDAEGCDFRAGERTARLEFSASLAGAADATDRFRELGQGAVLRTAPDG